MEMSPESMPVSIAGISRIGLERAKLTPSYAGCNESVVIVTIERNGFAKKTTASQ
jgi:hypothetical protein